MSGEWLPVDGGKEYSMNWTTNTSTSETQKVAFDENVKGTALRIYIMDASSSYVIDELTVGTAVSVDDVQIILDMDEMTLAEGETAKLTATVLPEYVSDKNVVFSSSNEAVLTVDSDGTLTVQGLPEGSEKEAVIVTATTEYGNKTAQCVVTVVPKTADDEDKQDTQTRLKNARKLADAADHADYKEGAVQAFGARLDEIEARLEGEQDEIDQAWRTLLKAMSELRLKPSKEALEALIASAQNLDIEDVPEETAAIFRSALAKAVNTAGDEQATADEVATAEQELQAALAQVLASVGGGTEEKPQTEKPAGNTGGSANGDQNVNDAADGTGGAGESRNGGTNGSQANGSGSRAVKTGDSTALLLWAVLLAAAGAAGGASVRASRRRK